MKSLQYHVVECNISVTQSRDNSHILTQKNLQNYCHLSKSNSKLMICFQFYSVFFIIYLKFNISTHRNLNFTLLNTMNG